MDTSNFTTKRCTKCNCDLPADTEHFGLNKLGKYGLDSRCKKCRAEIARLKRAENGAKTRPNRKHGDLRQCSCCLRWMPEDDDHFRKRSDSENYCSWCRECLREKNRNYQANRRTDPDIRLKEKHAYKRYYYRSEIREKKLAYMSKWYKENITRRKLYSKQYEQSLERKLKRRIRTRTQNAKRKSTPGQFTSKDVQIQIEMQKGKCWWCGELVGDNYEIDHRIPLSRGGTNYPENICIACFNCNRSKGSKMPHEWIGRLL